VPDRSLLGAGGPLSVARRRRTNHSGFGRISTCRKAACSGDSNYRPLDKIPFLASTGPSNRALDRPGTLFVPGAQRDRSISRLHRAALPLAVRAATGRGTHRGNLAPVAPLAAGPRLGPAGGWSPVLCSLLTPGTQSQPGPEAAVSNSQALFRPNIPAAQAIGLSRLTRPFGAFARSKEISG
jgi:hypothetical protein